MLCNYITKDFVFLVLFKVFEIFLLVLFASPPVRKLFGNECASPRARTKTFLTSRFAKSFEKYCPARSANESSSLSLYGHPARLGVYSFTFFATLRIAPRAARTMKPQRTYSQPAQRP